MRKDVYAAETSSQKGGRYVSYVSEKQTPLLKRDGVTPTVSM